MSAIIKTIIVHHQPDPNDYPAQERWFWKHHCPEVLLQAPWLCRYVMYRAVPVPPPGAEAYGYYNYRVHENWIRSSEGRRGRNGSLSMTPQPGKMEVVVVSVPAEPTEDFMGAGLRYGEKTILRWLTIFRYPDGVPVEEGEDWYLNVHVPEVMKQPGLIRFFSHKAIENKQSSPLPHSAKQKPFVTDPGPLFFKQWHRVSELWYENNNGWVDSVLKSPPRYTKPPWARYDQYPFLEPRNEFISTFILERPDQDMLRDYEPVYI
ncbi:MAG: hypothetical protein K6T65_13930 [Peptococcaceae bacterium]|nr:hypothetical protein [Peptococcaceae bacterium]